MVRVYVKPELLKWACKRAAPSVGDLYEKNPRIKQWISGETKPTLKQLEEFAKSARVAIGFLFLSEPPVEELPIKDLRTKGGKAVNRPSPDLLDTIYSCQFRQDWFRDYARKNELPKCPLYRIAKLDTNHKLAATKMSSILDYGVSDRIGNSDIDEQFRIFTHRVESASVLVMVGGTVGTNTRRALNVDEFRGFALADEYAPIVFVNGKDAKAAKMFTLAHELAHICLGESALSNLSMNGTAHNATEVWCNKVAAEFLVPEQELVSKIEEFDTDLGLLAQVFSVSKPVILRRLLDIGSIEREEFNSLYSVEVQSYEPRPSSDEDEGQGGHFYNSLRRRISPKFAGAVIGSALEGDMLYADAYQLLEVSNHAALMKLASLVGISE